MVDKPFRALVGRDRRARRSTVAIRTARSRDCGISTNDLTVAVELTDFP